MPNELVDVLADLSVEQAVSLSIALFAGSLVPFFLLVDADHLLPRAVRELPAAACPLVRDVCRDTAALVLLLTTKPQGAMA